jgi:hypothetical protein
MKGDATDAFRGPFKKYMAIASLRTEVSGRRIAVLILYVTSIQQFYVQRVTTSITLVTNLFKNFDG